jgi:tyrosinase
MQRWTSQPIPVPTVPDAPWERADLEFESLTHDGPSYAVVVFLNNPDVAEDAAPDTTPGYAGRFTVFAHGRCWGDAGHCDLPTQPVTPFDRRPPHPLTPIDITVEITDALRALGPIEEVTVTALAFSTDPAEREDVLRFSRLTLITYDPPATI